MNEEYKQVVITDIRMPFMSMVIFMVKWVIASIPAVFILTVISSLFIMMLEKVGLMLQM